MFKKKKLWKLLGLGVISMPLYHFSKKKYDYSQNTFLTNKQINNKEENFPDLINPNLISSKNDILIIGAGIAGISQAYYLLNNTDKNVILIDKSEEIASGSSNSNACSVILFDPFPLISKEYLIKNVKSLLKDRNSNLKINFWSGIINYPNGINWGLNMLMNLTENSKVNNFKNLEILQEITRRELLTINENLKNEYLKQGAIKIHLNKESPLKLKEKHKKFNKFKDYYFEFITKEDFLKKEVNLIENQSNWLKSDIITYHPEMRHLETRNFINKMYENCLEFKERFVFLNKTEFRNFIIEKNEGKVLGILTNKGKLIVESIFICAGLYSREITAKLGYRLPILPVKGYTMTIPYYKGMKEMSNSLYDVNNFHYLMFNEDKLRIGSPFGEFKGENLEKEKFRVDYFIENVKKKN